MIVNSLVFKIYMSGRPASSVTAQLLWLANLCTPMIINSLVSNIYMSGRPAFSVTGHLLWSAGLLL